MDHDSPHKDQYLARINRVIDYIEAHLTETLSLQRLAAIACFSPFHFHRTFAGAVGETLNQFINRVRIERAASQLITSPHKSITAIALDSGFSSSATFARAFKGMYGMSASQWREGGYSAFSKNGKTGRKIGKDRPNGSGYSRDATTAEGAFPVLPSLNDRSIDMQQESSVTTEVKLGFAK